MHNNTVDDRLHGIAAIIAAIPRLAWITLVGLILFFTVSALVLHRNAIPGFVDTVLNIVGYSVDVALGLILLRIIISIYRNYHNVYISSIERQQAKQKLNTFILRNDLLAVKVKERTYVPQLIMRAIES